MCTTDKTSYKLRWLIEGHEPKLREKDMMIAALEQGNREVDEKDKKIAALEQKIRELAQLKEVGPEEETKVQSNVPRSDQ